MNTNTMCKYIHTYIWTLLYRLVNGVTVAASTGDYSSSPKFSELGPIPMNVESGRLGFEATLRSTTIDPYTAIRRPYIPNTLQISAIELL